MELLADQAHLQAEADEVLADLNLVATLAAVGMPHSVGSRALRVMVRRDIDLTIACEGSTCASCTDSASVALHTRVRVLRFRDDTGEWNVHRLYPDGVYWGIEYVHSAGTRWSLDVWFVDEPERQPDLRDVRDFSCRCWTTTMPVDGSSRSNARSMMIRGTAPSCVETTSMLQCFTMPRHASATSRHTSPR